MAKLSIVFLGASAVSLTVAAFAQAPAPQGQPGFFRPSPDPAITAFRRLPNDPSPPQAPAARAAAPASTAPQPISPASSAQPDPADEIRKAEEVAMDRVEARHERVLAANPPRLPAITSPLDGTAPIMSPLDGTAPIVTPTAR
jgi:hypothetical protein